MTSGHTPFVQLAAAQAVRLALVLSVSWLGATAATAASAAIDPAAGRPPLVQVPASAMPLRPAPAKVAAAAATVESSPTWRELGIAQQQALAPLAATWPTLSEGHKRKWIALSQNFRSLPAEERVRLHSRMAEWAALTPQQRYQARFNFSETRKLPATDKKAKWEAYQALPPEEKDKLAARAARTKPAAPSTAAAVKPVPAQKMTRVPTPARPDNRTPRMAVLPAQVDHNTLLPQPGAAVATP